MDRLGLHLDAQTASAPLKGDSDLIQRLVSNLVGNAIGHNVEGGWIKMSTATRSGAAVLSVSSIGQVIPPTEIDRLFQPFQRLDPRRTHQSEGHGLGLSIVAAIAETHGATITANPGPQGGLKVEVAFPASINERGSHQSDLEAERLNRRHESQEERAGDIETTSR